MLGSCQLLQFLQCLEWITLRMNFRDKLLNWILNWIIFLASRLCSLWSPGVKTFTLKLRPYEFWTYIFNRHFAVLNAMGKWSCFNIIVKKIATILSIWSVETQLKGIAWQYLQEMSFSPGIRSIPPICDRPARHTHIFILKQWRTFFFFGKLIWYLGKD